MSKKELEKKIRLLEQFLGISYVNDFGGLYMSSEWGNWKYLSKFIKNEQLKEELERNKLFK